MDEKQFRADGFAIVRNVFRGGSRARLEAVRDLILAQLESPGVQRNAQFVYGADESSFQALAKEPALIEVARTILGDNICLLPTPRVLLKDNSFSGTIAAHQDWPYFPGNTFKLNCFIALTRCNSANGGLIFYRRSHLAGPVERGNLNIELFPQFEPVCPSLESGDVLFADFLTWHSSSDATEISPRLMLQVILQPADDASSDDVVSGVRSHDIVLRFRLDPLETAFPVFSFQDAISAFEQGNIRKAEQYARGLNQTDPSDPRPKLLLSRICRNRADPTAATYYEDLAATAFEKLSADMLPLEAAKKQRHRDN